MGLFKDFKKFAVKGNVVDLAVAVIIGAAFGKIISSFVNDVLMPPIGLLLGDVDFKELVWEIKEGAPAVMSGDAVVTEAVAPVTINYGMFIQNVVDFIIIAFVIFMMIRAIVKAQKKEEAPPPPPPGPTKEETLLTEIRDLLKK
jgi:large conductance mechanosensitive channel